MVSLAKQKMVDHVSALGQQKVTLTAHVQQPRRKDFRRRRKTPTAPSTYHVNAGSVLAQSRRGHSNVRQQKVQAMQGLQDTNDMQQVRLPEARRLIWATVYTPTSTQIKRLAKSLVRRARRAHQLTPTSHVPLRQPSRNRKQSLKLEGHKK